MENSTRKIATTPLLVVLACSLLLQHCKHDEPIKKDTYPLTAILSVNAGGDLFFKTISAPDREVIDYFNTKYTGATMDYKGPWTFKNIYIDEATRFFEKDANDQYQVKDTFLMQCKIHEDYIPPGPIKGFGFRYPYVEVVAIKPYR